MTLILTVANSGGVYQSSDYQLTDARTGAPVSDSAGSKQLQAGFPELHLNLAFTGVATVGTSRTIDWLSAELKVLRHDSGLQEICEALAKRCTTELRSPSGVLTVVLAVATVRQPFRLALISNARWSGRPPRAKDHFEIRIHTITKPFHLISGYRESVPQFEQHRLRALARVSSRTPKEILDALKAINASAAQNSHGYVSEECWATYQVADGRARRTAGINSGKQGGSVPLLQGEFDLDSFIRKNMPGLGRLVQSAGVFGSPVKPAPPPEGEPRSFTLAGTTVTGHLLSASGQRCASLRVKQLDCQITARRNETVAGPFARVQFSFTRRPMCADFPKPLLPWPAVAPTLTIDGAVVPNGWSYRICYWVEEGVHHVRIPPSSRAIRNVAFLGDDDELVITVPISEHEVTWLSAENGPIATLEARISWRTRPEK